MNKKNRGFTTIELITSFTLASVIMLILFNIILILKDNLSEVNAKTNMLVNKDNLSYNINKRFKEKEISSITMCEEGDKCYKFTYSDDTSDKLIYSNADKTITFNNYTFDIIDGITVEEPTITEHYDTMSSTTYNGYFIIHIPIKIDNKDYSIKVNKHFNTDSLVIDFPKYEFDNEGNRYTLVEYLESTGTQYIDTGILSNTNIIREKAIIKINRNHVRQLSGTNYGWWWGVSENDYYEGASVNSSNIMPSSINYDFVEYIVDYPGKKQEFIINGQSYVDSETGIASLGLNKEIYLFAINNFRTKAYMYAKLKIFQIYDNDTLVRDYIPVIDSSERPCLFDKVSRECYYNQGTGEFLYG